MSTVLRSDDGATAVLTVNRPEAMNACNVEVLETLRDHLRAIALAEETRVVVLTGAGEKSFVAGADIKLMSTMTVLEARGWGALGHECCRLLETIPKPTVAAVNGFALGGGCELALACDLRYASARARFGQPEINLGIIPGWGGTQRLARAAGIGFAKELIMTGRMADAEEAQRRGLVNAVFPPEELMPKVLEIAAALASKSPVALAVAKEATGRALDADLDGNLRYEAALFGALFSSEDAREGMAAFIEKREPSFAGR